jgi:hypothetical protein
MNLAAGDRPLDVLRRPGPDLGLDPSREVGDGQCLRRGDRRLATVPADRGIAVDEPLVAGGLTRHQTLARSTHCMDDDHAALAGQRVGRERDPGGVGVNHDLNEDRHLRDAGRHRLGPPRDFAGLGPPLPVRRDPRRGRRVEHLTSRIGQFVEADAEDRLVLSGERRAGEILLDG